MKIMTAGFALEAMWAQRPWHNISMQKSDQLKILSL